MQRILYFLGKFERAKRVRSRAQRATPLHATDFIFFACNRFNISQKPPHCMQPIQHITKKGHSITSQPYQLWATWANFGARQRGFRPTLLYRATSLYRLIFLYTATSLYRVTFLYRAIYIGGNICIGQLSYIGQLFYIGRHQL